VEAPFGSVRVHPLTLSYTPESMRCDSQASFLACNLASPCLGRKPKARVATMWRIIISLKHILMWPMKNYIYFKGF